MLFYLFLRDVSAAPGVGIQSCEHDVKIFIVRMFRTFLPIYNSFENVQAKSIHLGGGALDAVLSGFNNILICLMCFYECTLPTRKWHSESADPAKALGPSDILDCNPVVDKHYLLFKHSLYSESDQ